MATVISFFIYFKNKRHFYFAVLSLFITHYLNAQDLPCANELFQSKQLEDTGFVRQLLNIRQAEDNSNQRINGTVLEIPLAVHVLHLGEPVGTGTNIPDQQIIDAVQGANERWRKINTADGVDMEVQFCLAQFDPNGNPSSGIIRKDASGIPLYADKGIGYIEALLQGEFGANEDVVKNFSNWPHDFVLNIWVVNKIAGGWGGYALFPLASINFPTDGVVITVNSIRYTSSTLAHELGHAMGLFHTFQGSDNGCPANNICASQGDWICDTPPHKKPDCINSDCNNSPDSLFSFKNTMSYCSGRGLFTQGQKDRVRFVIANSTRKLLLQSYACYGPPCDTARTFITAQTCNVANAGIVYDTLSTSKGCDSIITSTTTLIPAPVASFTFTNSGQTVTFTNTSQNATNYTWHFGDDSTSNEVSPTHTYLITGNINVQLIAENSCSTDNADSVVTLLNTGIRNQSNESKLSIYPNPNNGNFTMNAEVKPAENAYIEIMNSLGQTLLRQTLVAGKEHTLSFEKKLPTGIYQLHLTKNGFVIGSSSILVY